jgi:uncharacterized Zn finger protein
MTVAEHCEVDLDALRGMVSPAVWARGQDYAERGLVSLTSVAPDRVLARVEGSETYRCVLAGDGLLDMACSCPAFRDFPGPCKHLVATALTLAHRSDDGMPASAERLRRFLSGLPAERLVELLVGLAKADPDLEARLLLQADAAAASPSELGEILRQAIADALRTGDFVDYRRMDDWAGRVDHTIDQLMATAHAGTPQAATVLELVPELIAGLERAVEHTDDDGHIGMLLDRSTDLLGAAAIKGNPDPVALAQLISRLDLECEYAEIGPPAGVLAEALGDDGLAAYWSTLEAEWAKLSALRPTERKSRQPIDDADSCRWKLRQRLVARARAQADVDAEIAILAKTLTSPHDYLEVARACHHNGRLAEAASWIDEALWFFSPRENRHLARDGAPILAEAGQAHRALSLLWEQFTHHPSLESYQDLERLAGPVGEAATWRERTFDWLDQLRRDQLSEAERPILYGQNGSTHAADVLVELSLAVADLERAWDVARMDKLSQRVWRRLADASAVTRPADSIQVYQMIADQAVASGHKQGYCDAVDLMGVIKRLGASIDDGSAIDAWVGALRTKHKAKRSFIAMLDRANW